MLEGESQAPVAPGEVLAGKYRVERVLGAGGMGIVVQAFHLELEERVAVKFLLPHAVSNAEAATRFVREARAVVRIKSEHVARVSDVGRLENGSPYIVMEYLEGNDLGVVIQEGAQEVEVAVDYVLQACLAIAEAHAAGIIHRDLKPSNLFLARRPDGTALVKVLDFGISKVMSPDRPDAKLTRTSTLMGSPLYMSPEQLRSSRDVDHRTDIWSLGVILFELLTRAAPFQAETLPQLIASVLSDVPPLSLAELRPDTPQGLIAVVMRCLERNPDYRFSNVGELAHALAPFASRHSRYITERLVRPSILPAPGALESMPPGSLVLPSSAPPAPGSAEARTVADAGTASAWTEQKTRGGGATNRKVPWLIAGGVATLALAAGGWVALGRMKSPDAAAEAAKAVATTGTSERAAPAAAAPVAEKLSPTVTPTPAAAPAPASAPSADRAASAEPTSASSNHARPPSAHAPKTPTPSPAAATPTAPPATAAAKAVAAAPAQASAEARKSPPKNPLAVELK